MLVFTFSSIGLPGLNGFVGEFMVLLGAFQLAWTGAPSGWEPQFKLIAVLAVTGVVLGAWYMLWLVQRVFFGPVLEPGEGSGKHDPVPDLFWREVMALVPLTVFMVWIGIQPTFFLDRMQPSLREVNKIVDASLQRHVAVWLPDTQAEAAETVQSAYVHSSRIDRSQLGEGKLSSAFRPRSDRATSKSDGDRRL
jgi:NADH-quinone oxidoreductase subunit M